MPTPLFANHPGVGVTISSSPAADPVADARHAEALGFDLVTVHRDVPHGPPPSLETWTLLTWIAAHTSRVLVAPAVLALPNRHPAVLAKMAETLDRLSGGRLVVALGAGGAVNDSAFDAFGLAHRSAAEKVAATEEAIDVLRGLWRPPRRGLSYRGAHFTTTAAEIQPRPDRPIPLWLGAFGTRMLDLVGRKADGWLPSWFLLGPERAARGLRQVRDAAARAGRDPDALTYGCNVGVLVQEGAAPGQGRMAGGPEVLARQLAELVDAGFTFLNLWPAGDAAAQRAQRERLAHEVLPVLRAYLQTGQGARS
jgi:alkanesulfonate monooxygenase SsuD/methylene tetrahydromethanopterin reductase-like flavin-dependent oxidoreductase (luciferase family)